jgi:Tol biopolymer transport system component
LPPFYTWKRFTSSGIPFSLSNTFQSGNSEIYIVNANGDRLRQLTNNPAQDRYPAWSSDGRKIAFQSDRDGG